MDTSGSNLVELPAKLSAIEFKGELPFDHELRIDISQMLQEADYGNSYLDGVARDGSNILISAESNSVQTVDNLSTRKRGYIRVDTESGEAQWVFTGINASNFILFDENNNAIVVGSVGCLDIDYIDVANESPINFNGLIPDDRCLGRSLLSDDGSVLVFETANREFIVDGIINQDTKYFAYNLISSLIQEFPDTSIASGELTLEPTIPLFSNPGIRPFLSYNGNYVISKQRWGLDDESVNSTDLIGSILWNTQTNQWQTRGLFTGDRDSCDFDLSTCSRPFQYLLSADGNVQYSQIPNGDVFGSDRFDSIRGSTMVRSLSSDSNEIPIVGLVNALPFAVNRDGRLLSFYAAEVIGDLPVGLTIYDNNSGEYNSVEPALPTCASQSSEANESNCEGIPANGSWNTFFSADSSHLLIGSSVFPSTSEAEYTLELESGDLYSLPSRFSAFPRMVNGDSTVFSAPSQDSEHVYLIARR